MRARDEEYRRWVIRVSAQPGATTVIAADDHPLYLKAVRETLEADPRLQVIAVASDGRRALELITKHTPQVAVLDVRMPELDGREVMRRLRRAESPTRVLFVSEYHAGELVLSTLRERGAAGTHLSPRELTILELMAEGGTAQQIAQRIHLAVPTVKTHIQNLYVKLGVNDRGAAVAEGMRRGLLS